MDDIHLDAAEGCEDAARWFYGELAGLEERATDPDGPSVLCFKSERVRLRIWFASSGDVDPVPVRLAIAVPSLDEIATALEERKRPFDRLSGLASSDRRLQVLDPMGYRVEFRQSSWVGPL